MSAKIIKFPNLKPLTGFAWALEVAAPASTGSAVHNSYSAVLAPVPTQVIDPARCFIARRGTTFADQLKTDEELLTEQAVDELAADPDIPIH
ncbi:hypothetical protein [Pseudomonas plecoglossicida]|uniref:hypothetical protein n=1 Tax=Pseudomonas plecoglossicida TaxID=70775 RepID=UPI000490CE3C|nr:hypothetical protein [Pseudomonas plecoglossicida]GLR36163.1 hypothetical protein GCM10011247_15600 [Pseudomonas plecoglossicida]